MHKILEIELRKEFKEVEANKDLTREDSADKKNQIIQKYVRIHEGLVKS